MKKIILILVICSLYLTGCQIEQIAEEEVDIEQNDISEHDDSSFVESDENHEKEIPIEYFNPEIVGTTVVADKTTEINSEIATSIFEEYLHTMMDHKVNPELRIDDYLIVSIKTHSINEIKSEFLITYDLHSFNEDFSHPSGPVDDKGWIYNLHHYIVVELQDGYITISYAGTDWLHSWDGDYPFK